MQRSILASNIRISAALLALFCTSCGSTPGRDSNNSSGAHANSASGGGQSGPTVKVVMATGLLQKCLGITPGADRMCACAPVSLRALRMMIRAELQPILKSEPSSDWECCGRCCSHSRLWPPCRKFARKSA